MKKRFLGIAAALALVCIALVGCNGGGAASQDYTANFAGEWELVSMESADPITEDDIQTMKDLGLTVTLVLSEDGTADLNMFGESMGSATWEAKSATECSFTSEGAEATLTLDSSTGRLRFSQGDEALVFTRTEG